MAKVKKTEQAKVADMMNENTQEDIDVEIEESTAISVVEGENLPAEWQFGKWETISSVIWRPEPGWALMGTYKGRTRFDDGDFDSVCALHTVIDYKTGMPVTFVGGTMLDKFIMKSPVGSGTRIIIKRLDMSETKKGRHVNNWDLKIDPSTAVEDYSPQVDEEILAAKTTSKG